MDAYYCLEQAGKGGQPLDCRDVRCDACPNRGKIIPQKPLAEDAGFNAPWTEGDGYVIAKPDMVLHPSHYARWKMEPIEFIAINDLPWWLANVIKYTMRFDAKDGLQDLYKARSYLDMKIRSLEGVHKRFWDKPVTEERSLAHAKGTRDALDLGWQVGLRAADANYTVHNAPRVEGAAFELRKC